jgi:hypothetical protein
MHRSHHPRPNRELIRISGSTIESVANHTTCRAVLQQADRQLTRYPVRLGLTTISREVFALFRLPSTQNTRSQYVRIALDQGTGRGWSRPSDHFGLAFVENGLSHDHEEYLSLGGKGFIIGDGRLNYGREKILETFYSIALKHGFALAPNSQYVANPAYNRDGGPVPICALRLHWKR